MTDMTNWQDARKMLESWKRFGGTVSTPLSSASGKVLGSDLVALIDSPVFDNSAVDGYGVNSDSNFDSSFTLVGDQFAGSCKRDVALKLGETIRIMTGAHIPPGVNQVLMWEDCSVIGNLVKTETKSRPGQNIRHKGEDFLAEDLLLKCGSAISPGAIGLIISAGRKEVECAVPPVVGLLVTGSELREPGERLFGSEIYNSNAQMLTSALKEMGVDTVVSVSAKDDLGQTLSELNSLLGRCDLVFTVGGLAEGDRDFVIPALKKLQANSIFRGVAMKPGKPVSFFTLQDKAVLCLPGNPVSALITLFVFGRPLIARWLGNHDFEQWITLKCGEEMTKRVGRVEFVPGSIFNDQFVPIEKRGSHLLKLVSSASHLGLFDSANEWMNKGQPMRALDFRWGWT